MKWNVTVLLSYWRYGFVDVQYETVFFQLSCCLQKATVFVKV